MGAHIASWKDMTHPTFEEGEDHGAGGGADHPLRVSQELQSPAEDWAIIHSGELREPLVKEEGGGLLADPEGQGAKQVQVGVTNLQPHGHGGEA